MLYSLAADLTVWAHAVFVLFVAGGGLLALKWRWIVWIHVPAAIWGTLVEFTAWMCPLTHLENSLRQAAGESGYAGGFVEHYVVPVLYPEGLTRGHQILLGLAVIAVNTAVYGWLIRSRWRSAR